MTALSSLNWCESACSLEAVLTSGSARLQQSRAETMPKDQLEVNLKMQNKKSSSRFCCRSFFVTEGHDHTSPLHKYYTVLRMLSRDLSEVRGIIKYQGLVVR